jgi:serine/threonine protein kinase
VDSQPDPDIQIAGYRIEARVGRGGMGEVYRAVQLSLGRRVALKILAPELADDDVFRRRFLRESRIAASIDHPSIIPIYETGEEGGLLYIAMRYVDGMDLATLLKREGRLEPARALAIMTQVASALDAAHARGLVHRDVKPANILLAASPAGTDGHCYLCDFGLIKQVGTEEAQSALTATDQFVGTIPYVSPEQIEGRSLDGRADVYSLGCVLFHCLTGSAPFQGSTDIEVVFAHMREPPPPLSGRAPHLPRTLDAIIARAMAKSRDDRWPTCSSLIAALKAQVPPELLDPSPTPDAETRSMPRPRRAAPRSSAVPTPAPLGPAAPAAPNRAPAPLAPAAPNRAPGPLNPAPATPQPDPEATAPHPAPSPYSSAPGHAAPGGAPSEPVPDPGATVRQPAASAADPGATVRLPAAAGAGSPPPPAPPLGRPARTPDHPRPASGPPEGERSPAVSGVPGAVHRGGGAGRRRGRGWLIVLAAVALPAAAYFATTQFLLQDQRVGTAPDPTVVETTPPVTAGSECPGGFTQPAAGTPSRTAPLDAIRAHTGWSDRFMVDEMRAWRTSEGHRRWYVKASQEGDESRNGRWLVGQDQGGQPRVLASAAFDTQGYVASDWDVADGQKAPTGVAGCLSGT